MKKYLAVIVVALTTLGLSYVIGYYVGYNTPESKQATETSIQTQTQDTASTSKPQDEIETLKESLQTEQAKSKKLQQELNAKENKIAQLEQFSAESTVPPKEEIIPATPYERENFVMNLVHQFNADNQNTVIDRVSCTHDTCQVIANIAAGTKTNPEIANLMKFLDDRSEASMYNKISLIKVFKDDDYSEVEFSLKL